MKINHKLLCLFEGKCWHEWKEIYLTNNHTISSSPTFECRYCGEYFTDNPDFSQPAQRDEFIKWISKERPEMWEAYLRDCHHGECYSDDFAYHLDLSNFADFLCLPSTIERWGWETKTWVNFDGHVSAGIKTPWARYAEEGV